MVPSFRLVFPPHAWREQIPAIARVGGLGIAHLVRNFYQDTRELVVGHLRLVPPTVRGWQTGPLDDLLLIRCQARVEEGDAERLLTSFASVPTQLVAGLVLGHGPASGQWVASVWNDGRVHPVNGFTFVGPGMLRATREPELPEKVEALERWSRTRGALGDEVWRKVRASRVAVVGAGRNGSVAALTLAMLGARGLTLIDSDIEELHNLDASVGGTPVGVGRPKVQNRAEFLQTIRPTDLEVEAIPQSVQNSRAVMALRGVDLVITCVDSDAARLTGASLARIWGKVHLDIGTGIFGTGGDQQMGADVRLLLPGEACVSCLGGLRDSAEAERESAAPPGTLRRGQRREWRQQRAGSLLPLNQMAVNLGVKLWLELLGGGLLHSCWERLEWRNAVLDVRVEDSARASCVLCRPDTLEGLPADAGINPFDG